jgi:primosomal protein N' (replication factor Y)
MPPPSSCSQCHAPDTALLGIGTERVEEEVRARFPTARVARLDRDTERRPGGAEALLRALRAREIDVLVGTQMVAKGHDFPGVRLVGVVAADIGLHLPDFRAAERTFQLLTQVAGRAGRGDVPGEVVIQTFVPDHYAIRPVAQHDYESFYAEEIRHRATLGYPPCGALAVTLVSGPDLDVVMRCAERLRAAAAGSTSLTATNTCARDSTEVSALEILGPAPAPLARLRDRYRVQLLLRSRDSGLLRAGAQRVSAALSRLPAGVRAHVDVHPFHML